MDLQEHLRDAKRRLRWRRRRLLCAIEAASDSARGPLSRQTAAYRMDKWAVSLAEALTDVVDLVDVIEASERHGACTDAA